MRSSPFLRMLGRLGFETDIEVRPQPLDSPMHRLLRRIGADVDVVLSVSTGKRPESMLRSYQRYLADCIYEMPAVLGAAEMSLGKTGATLTGARRLLRDNPGWRALIVAPLEVARNTWPDEIAEWEHLQDVTYSVVVGTPEQRLAALKVDCDFTIINRENLGWLWKTIRGAIGWRWQILIYDESSRLKGFVRRTAGSETIAPQLSEFGVLAAARPRMERVVELSGTPSPNGLIDLGGQAYILDQGKRLGRSKTAFQQRWFNKNEYTFAIEPKEHAEKEIMDLMKDVMIGLRSEDYIDLPPRHFNPVYVKLTPKLMREYREFEKTLVSEPYDVEALTKGVLTNKLLQFSNGGLYRGNPDDPEAPRETIAVHDLKLKALESIIAEAAGKPVLIAYAFQFDLQRIMKRFPQATYFKNDPNFVKNWNAGKIKIGIAHPASIGHGLNLQYGGFIQVWFGLTWSLELWDQFNRRLARPGQAAHTVFIHVIMAKGTEDERQYSNLQTKGITQDRITNAVRVRLPMAA